MQTKRYGPNILILFFCLFIPAIIFLAAAVFYSQPKYGAPSYIPIIFSIAILAFWIVLLGEEVTTSDEDIAVKLNMIMKRRIIIWKDIVKLTYWKSPFWGDVLIIKESTNPRQIMISRLFVKNREIIREVVAHIPPYVNVDPRLYTKELDKSATLRTLAWFLFFLAIYLIIILAKKLILKT